MNQKIQITIQRKKIKNLYIRIISPQQILVTCNKAVSEADIFGFIEKKKNWIDRCIAKIESAETAGMKSIESGSNILLAEKIYSLTIEKSKTNTLKQISETLYMTLCDTDDEETKEKLLLKWYRNAFYNYAAERIDTILREKKGYNLRRPDKISIKDTLSRWGSYSKKTNTLALSIRLGTYSKKGIDSVIYHELAHTRHMNHQKEFYSLLYALMPEYKQGHNELKSKRPKEYWYLIS